MQYDQNRSHRFTFVVLLVFLSVRIFACDLCGAFIGVLPYDNQSSFSLQHRYRIFNGYGSNTGLIFPSGAYRLPPDASVLHGPSSGGTVQQQDDFESYKTYELRGKWFIHPRCEISFILPFVENKSSCSGIKEQSSGLGDITLLAAYHLVKIMPEEKFRHRLVSGIGIKLPSGKHNQIGTDGIRIPLMMQAGTGSTDAIVYLAYTGGAYNFRWGLSSSGKYSGKNANGEQLCPSESATVFAGYVLSAGQWKFIPQVQAFQEYLRGMRTNGVLDESSGMNALLAGPSLSLFRKNISADLGIHLPVYDHTDPSNLLNRGRLFAAISWNFNQTNYLLKKNT